MNTSNEFFVEIIDPTQLYVSNEVNNVPDSCWLWCKEQYFNHQNNLTIEGMIIPSFAIISLLLGRTLITYSDYLISKSILTEDDITKLYIGLNDFAFLLLIGFFIWFLFFTG